MSGLELLRQLNDEMAHLAETGRRSLVRISSGQGRAQGNGAGTIWQSDGLIVTNAHVVAHGPLEVALPDGHTLPARILAADPALDVAAIMVEASGLPTIALGNSKRLQPGQWVFAMGHPWGVIGGSTAGIIIGTGDQLPEMPPNRREWIALSLHLRPGHSGGPLLDHEGKLVGINTMITGPDVGFAIPLHLVKRFLRSTIGVIEQTAAPKVTMI